jgi:hypothetical protein
MTTMLSLSYIPGNLYQLNLQTFYNSPFPVYPKRRDIAAKIQILRAYTYRQHYFQEEHFLMTSTLITFVEANNQHRPELR